MPDCLHFHVGETCVNVCGGRLVVLHSEPDRVRWCFKCREHLLHDFVLWGDPGPSYYEPNPAYRCSGCGEDHTLGFGMEREWVDA